MIRDGKEDNACSLVPVEWVIKLMMEYSEVHCRSKLD